MDKELENLTYAVDYRDIKYPRLEFRTGTLLLVLPKNYETPNQLLEKHRKWIRRKRKTIEETLHKAKAKKLNQSRTTEELKAIVESAVRAHQNEIEVKVNRIFYRKMKTKWASCSPKKNLTINTLLRHLPKGLIEYVVFHEITHLAQKKHNDAFWRKISKRFWDYETKESDLLAYWFLFQTRTK